MRLKFLFISMAYFLVTTACRSYGDHLQNAILLNEATVNSIYSIDAEFHWESKSNWDEKNQEFTVKNSIPVWWTKKGNFELIRQGVIHANDDSQGAGYPSMTYVVVLTDGFSEIFIDGLRGQTLTPIDSPPNWEMSVYDNGSVTASRNSRTEVKFNSGRPKYFFMFDVGPLDGNLQTLRDFVSKWPTKEFGKVSDGGENLYHLQTIYQSVNSEVIFDFYLDADAGFLIKKVIQSSSLGHTLIFETTGFKQLGNGVFFPKDVTYSLLVDGKKVSERTCIFDSLTINQPDVRQLTLPENLVIFDMAHEPSELFNISSNDTGISRFLVMGKDNRIKQELSAEELDHLGVKFAEETKKGNISNLPTTPATLTVSKLFLIISGLVLIILSLYFKVKRRHDI